MRSSCFVTSRSSVRLREAATRESSRRDRAGCGEELSSRQDALDRGDKSCKAAQKSRGKVEPLGVNTGEFVEQYLLEIASRKAPKTQASYRRYGDLFGPLRELPIASVNTADAYELHLRITEENGPIVANRALSLLSQVHKHAARLGLRSGENPTTAIQRNPENTRTAYLTQPERIRFIGAARMAALAGEAAIPAVGALLLMVLSGRRSSEARLLRWSEVQLFDEGEDAGTGLIVLATRVERGANKSDEHRALPLSASAAAVIRSMPRWCEYVFASRRTGLPYTDVRKPLAAVVERAGLRRITPHALRHTYGTACAEAGLTPDEIAACLGHKGRESARRYVHLAGRSALGAARKAAQAAGGMAL